MKLLRVERTGDHDFGLRFVLGVEVGDACPIDRGPALPYTTTGKTRGRPHNNDWERWDAVAERENLARSVSLRWDRVLDSGFGFEVECPVCHDGTRIVVWSGVPPRRVRCTPCDEQWRSWLNGDGK